MTKGRGRGFKSLSPQERAEVSRKGGRAAQASGKTPKFNSETARAAASKPRGPRKTRMGKFEVMPSEAWHQMTRDATFSKLASTVAAMACDILPNVQGVYLLVTHEGAEGALATTSKMMTMPRGDGWPLVAALIEGMEHDIRECDKRACGEGLKRVEEATKAPTVAVGLRLVKDEEAK